MGLPSLQEGWTKINAHLPEIGQVKTLFVNQKQWKRSDAIKGS